MSLTRIIDWRIAQAETQMTGTIASDFYQLQYDDGSGEKWTWACDVDIGEDEPMTGVPVASNNREIIYAEIGKAVALSKMSSGKWCISGLAKKCRGLGHIIYMSFLDDKVSVVNDGWKGKLTRRLSLGELGGLGPSSFGALPLGAYGRFDGSGNFLEFVGW